MKTVCRVTLLSALIIFSGSAVFAQEFSLKNRSVLEINVGMWGGTGGSRTVTATTLGQLGVRTTADAGSFIGNVLYAYGLRENLSVTLSAGVLSAGANADVGLLGVSQESGTVIPVLIGMRYYVPYPEPEAKVRPFLSLGVGTYLGYEQSTSVSLTVVQESHSESAFGGRVGAGVDFYVSDYFKLVANAGYNVMSDFSSPVTGRSNFNGGDFSVGVGYAF